MTLRQKVVAAFLGSFLVLLAGTYGITRLILLRGLQEIETAGALSDLDRVREALRQELSSLDNIAGDWAEWEDAYRYMGGGYPGFIAQNVTGSTFTNLRIGLLAFLAPGGEVRFARWFDLEKRWEAAPPAGGAEKLFAAGFLADSLRADRPRSGVVMLPQSPMLVACRPIHDGQGKGDPRGVLLMGRFLDAAEVEILSRATRLGDIEFRPAANPSLPPDFAAVAGELSASRRPALLPEGRDRLSVFAALPDIEGNPSLLLRVRTDRDVYRRGLAIQRAVLSGVAVVGAFIAFLALFLAGRLVLAPLFSLSREVDRIAAAGDIRRRLPAGRKDEIGSLTREINGMLDQMEGAQRALRRSEERLSVTLGSIRDGVITIDLEGKVLLLNPAAEALTGWKGGEAVGKPLAEVFALRQGKAPGPSFLPVEEVLHRGQPSPIPSDSSLVALRGGEREISGSLNPVKGTAGQAAGAVLVFRDMSEHRHFEEEILKARKLESLAVLAGGIAHDFNNLLTAIIGNLSMARAVLRGDEKATRFLEEGERAGQRAKVLAGQLLTFSRGGAPVKRRLSLAPVAREAIHSALVGTRAVAVFSLPPDLWTVEADESQLAQVFHNLAVNSAQAMPGGGIVTVRAENAALDAFNSQALPPGDYLKVTFEDEGEGIPEGSLPRIFDPFFTTRVKGTGLGLAIVYSILLRHRGRVAVRSTPGKGTVFTLYLPALVGEKPADPAPEEGEAVPLGKGKRILLVDAEEMICLMAREMLEELGFRVSCSQDGEEAKALFRAAFAGGDPYLAVILDLSLPGGGVELLGRLREMDPGVPAVVSSAYSQGEVVSRSADFGFAAVLAKPYNLLDMRAVLARILG